MLSHVHRNHWVPAVDDYPYEINFVKEVVASTFENHYRDFSFIMINFAGGRDLTKDGRICRLCSAFSPHLFLLQIQQDRKPGITG